MVNIDLNTYIRLNSKSISEITNLENKLKTLNVEQIEVVEYIKNKIDEQIILFLKETLSKSLP